MKPTIKFKSVLRGYKGVESKLISNGVIKINIDDTAIVDYIRKGHDVQLCSAKNKKPMIHVFQMLKKDGTPYVCARTMNPFRSCIEKCNISVAFKGKEYDGKEASKTLAEAHATNKKLFPRICVSPDKVIRCPKCETEIRVGRFLSEKKG